MSVPTKLILPQHQEQALSRTASLTEYYKQCVVSREYPAKEVIELLKAQIYILVGFLQDDMAGHVDPAYISANETAIAQLNDFKTYLREAYARNFQ